MEVNQLQVRKEVLLKSNNLRKYYVQSLVSFMEPYTQPIHNTNMFSPDLTPFSSTIQNPQFSHNPSDQSIYFLALNLCTEHFYHEFTVSLTKSV